MRLAPLLRAITATLATVFVLASTQPDCRVLEATIGLSGSVVLDQDKLDSLDGSIQKLLDCLPRGATLTLNVSALALDSPLLVDKPVSLGATGVVPPPVVHCGNTGPGALVIRSDDVMLSNISIEGCRLNQTSAPVEIYGAKNVTMQDIRCRNNININGAGCMHMESSTVFLHNITAEFNSGFFGGVIRIVGGKTTITESLFRGNNANVAGAAIFLQSSAVVKIAESAFDGNYAEAAGGGLGGENVQALKLSGVDFVNNSAYFSGGAVDVQGREGKSKVDVQDVNFVGNILRVENRHSETTPSGGAIALRNVSDAEISGSTFTINQGQKGGAIFSQYSRGTKGELKIKGSTFKKNKALMISEYIFPGGLAAGSRGGAIYVKGGEVIVESSRFESNRAEPSQTVSSLRSCGGAIFFTSENTSVNITLSGDTDFVQNTAPFGGAIHAARFMLKIQGGTYRKNSGGAVYLEGGRLRSFANITDATFDSNNQGGVFFGYFGGDHVLEVIFHQCRFFHNVSLKKGGAIHMKSPTEDISGGRFYLGVYDSIFASNKAGRPDGNDPSSLVRSVDGQGGAVCLEAANALVDFDRVDFSGNVAGVGGAIAANSPSGLSIQNSRFFDGQAFKGGALAVLKARQQSVSIRDVIFLNNTAQEGGAVFVRARERTLHKAVDFDLNKDEWPAVGSFLPPVSFWRTSFEENQAVDGGGGMDVRREHVMFSDCNFSMNRLVGMESSSGGGALRIMDFSRVDLFKSSVESSFARSGGGVYAEDSCVSGMDVALRNNTAFDNGGAIAAFFRPMLSCESLFPLSIISSNITENAARVGGGLHIVVASMVATNCTQQAAVRTDQQALFKYLSDCTGQEVDIFNSRQTLVGNTMIAKNDALDNGPAIFINDLSKLQVCCGPPSSCMSGRDIKRTPCEPNDSGLTWKRNTEKDSTAGGVATTIRDLKVSPNIIEGHASGRALQNIRVRTVDAFDQPAFERATLRVRSVSPAAVLSHSPVATDGVVVAGEVVVDGLVLKAKPGEYDLLFTLEPVDEFAESLNKTISVIIRDCLVGEVSKDGGRICQKCGAPFYSFDTSEETCQVCPKGAVCDGSTITPLLGYWHHDSHSPHIHKCECVKACDFSDRVDTLSFVSHSMGLLHGRAATAADGYAQCAKGFSGVLCGSCLPSFGKVRSLDCTACPSKAASRVIIGLVMLSLAVVSLIFVKSAARFSEQGTTLPNGASRRSASASTQPNFQTRASDVVKILVNFLQVTGTAATINVNWTEGMLGMLATMGLFSGISDNTGFLGFECAFDVGGAPRSVKATALMVCVPAAVWLIFLVFSTFSALRKKKALYQFKTDVIVSIFAVVQVSYISITQRLVRLFYCLDVAPSKDQFWAEDTSVVCYQGWHKLLVAVLGIPLLALVTIGFPAGLLLKLSRHRGKLQEPQIMSRFGSFYVSYKDSIAFWEVLILVRKALLSTITVFARQLGSGIQGDLSLFVMSSSALLQLQFQPFKDPKLNRLELVSVITSTITFMVGNLIGKTKEDWVIVPLSALLMGIISIFILVALHGIISAGKNDLKRWIAGSIGRGEGTARLKWGCVQNKCEEKLIAVAHFWARMTWPARPATQEINRDTEP